MATFSITIAGDCDDPAQLPPMTIQVGYCPHCSDDDDPADGDGPAEFPQVGDAFVWTPQGWQRAIAVNTN